jgi:hypothetical protein
MKVEFAPRALAVRALAVGALDGERLARVADALAAAVVVSLPWSTTATGILVGLWLLALIPTLDVARLRCELASTAGGVPVVFVALGVAGMLWADAPLADQLKSLGAMSKLLAIPLLLAQFRRSANSAWVTSGFLVSCTVLLVASYLHFALWKGGAFPIQPPGVPVKDYITQSGAFEICILCGAYVAVDQWQAGGRRLACALALLCLLFFIDITYVTTSRTTLVTLPVLLVLFGLVRLGRKGTLILVGAGIICAAVVWVSSPYLRLRVNGAVAEVALYRSTDAVTSSGVRVEFWRKSLQFVEEAPIIGHGTGSIHTLFTRAASGGSGASSIASTNPHEQILAVAVQLGLVGVAVLLALWGSHLMLFVGPGFAAWCGLVVVLQNIISSLFNSHLFDFTQGWMYVFGVGVLGGTVLQRRGNAEVRFVRPVEG